MNKSYPLVSCICLTRQRPLLLRKAIQAFLSQTYQPCELLITVRDDDPESKTVISSFGRDNVRQIEIPAQEERSIGELRNLAISHSRGEYFCQWDDDDWYHSTRIETQMRCLAPNAKSGSVLATLIVYDKAHREAYLSPVVPWSNTLLCRKDVISDTIRYPHLSFMEDTAFLGQLVSMNYLFPVLAPWTYIYVYHGQNTCRADHFRRLFERSKKLSPAMSQLVTDVLEEKLDNKEAMKRMTQPDVLEEMDYFNRPFPSRTAELIDHCKISLGRMMGRLFGKRS